MAKMIRVIIWVSFCFQFSGMNGQSVPQMRINDKLRIKEAITISKLIGENIWKGINNVPFAIILLTDSIEFLIHHPNPSQDFILSEKDPVLNTDIFYRKRQYPQNLLATFPAVNGVSCIVVGTPELTGKNSTEWIVTLLHEHFHQYETYYPDYYQSVDKLDLSGGDQTGMWMLNYPFPYDNEQVIEQYKKYTLSLSNVLAAINTKKFRAGFNKYKAERKKFKQLLEPADYRYLSFQLWQEGIARYTEYKFLELPGDYKPSKEISDLPDFISFSIYKEQLYQLQTDNLVRLKLNEDKRVCFYSIGFAEGVLLDTLNPGWRSLFLKEKFYIEGYSKQFK
jgi:hypothetical protein